jgi:hypothetical protein
MDTLSHGLWTTAVGKAVNIKSPDRIKLKWIAIWGVMPDILSFTPVIVWMLWQMFVCDVDFWHIPRPELLPPEERNKIVIFQLTRTLYQTSHSFVFFFSAFLLVWLVRWYTGSIQAVNYKNNVTRFMPFAMTGWFIHRALDIPTHSKSFYPTPFLYPISDFYFDGFSWGNMWFMICNYSALLLVFIVLRIQEKKTL